MLLRSDTLMHLRRYTTFCRPVSHRLYGCIVARRGVTLQAKQHLPYVPGGLSTKLILPPFWVCVCHARRVLPLRATILLRFDTPMHLRRYIAFCRPVSHRLYGCIVARRGVTLQAKQHLPYVPGGLSTKLILPPFWVCVCRARRVLPLRATMLLRSFWHLFDKLPG